MDFYILLWLYSVICVSGTFRKTNLKKWQQQKMRPHFACKQQQILNECWWGVLSFWWEPHLGRMAHRAIREQPFSFFLLSGHDYEKRTLWDNGPCIPCLAPIHKVGMLPSLQHHSSSVIRGRGGTFCRIHPWYHEKKRRLLEGHLAENGKKISIFIPPQLMGRYFHNELTVLPVKYLKIWGEKCPPQVPKAQSAFKCFFYSFYSVYKTSKYSYLTTWNWFFCFYCLL